MKSLPLLNEPEGLGLDLAGTEAPAVDRELAGHRHDGPSRSKAPEEGGIGEALRRLGQRSSLLRHNHAKLLVQIDSELDRGAAVITLAAGFLG